MDILNRLLGHDEWTTTQLLGQCVTLSPAQWQQEFDVGQGSLCETFDHLVDNVEAWTDLMLERPVRNLKGNTPDQLLQRWQAAYPNSNPQDGLGLATHALARQILYKRLADRKSVV